MLSASFLMHCLPMNYWIDIITWMMTLLCFYNSTRQTALFYSNRQFDKRHTNKPVRPAHFRNLTTAPGTANKAAGRWLKTQTQKTNQQAGLGHARCESTWTMTRADKARAKNCPMTEAMRSESRPHNLFSSLARSSSAKRFVIFTHFFFLQNPAFPRG